MTRLDSLAFRLFATTAAWALVVLPAAGIIIYQLYKKQVDDAFDQRIRFAMTAILADGIENGENPAEPGQPKSIGEPLFDFPQSGWYWQIKPIDASPERPARSFVSESLGSEPLPLLSDTSQLVEQQIYWGYVDGPLNHRLRQAETIYVFGEGDQALRYSFAVAGRTAEIDVTRADFKNRLVAALALVGTGLLASTLLQVRFGLSPLRRIEKGLAAIRSGDATRLEGQLPAEIESLQRELNALLTSNEEIIERARTQVGNLAHGLKTPLAVLLNEAEVEQTPLASKVTEQVGVMREQVQHYLDRARMAARAGAIGRVTDVQAVADGIVRALTRIHRTKDIAFTVDCEPGARFQGERQDLEEMLGNLLDNAAKWSKGAVRLTVAIRPAADGPTGGRRLILTIDDDGPGLTAEQLAQPIQRGRRLDESKPGSGLGHSIVADLVHSYRGKFTRSTADLGGLRVVLELPAA
jgi:signal transduction histidine kinase